MSTPKRRATSPAPRRTPRASAGTRPTRLGVGDKWGEVSASDWSSVEQTKNIEASAKHRAATPTHEPAPNDPPPTVPHNPTVEEVEPLGSVLKRAGKKALGGGMAGALAMLAQVGLLMWMRTVMNYQHANGLSTYEAFTTLYEEGGIARLYQGWQAALLQAPISRFGDTAANAGMLAILAGIGMPEGLKTFFASWAAAAFRILITPIDMFKTTLQVQGPAGLSVLQARIAKEGVTTLWSGALATSLATFMGHYPWFLVHNTLQKTIPKPQGKVANMCRSAFIGLCSSTVSDVVSNSIRVVKTKKQTAKEVLTYAATASLIISEDGVQGLFLRGLGTKIITNGISAMLFTVLWKYFEAMLTKQDADKKKTN